MPVAPAEIWYRFNDTPEQVAALKEARTNFVSQDDFAAAFWSSSEDSINLAHEVEAGFTTLQNYVAEVARWVAIEAGWRTVSAWGFVPYSTRKDYEALRDNGVISNARFSNVWSLQIERNHLTHERPEVDPRKTWVASTRVLTVTPGFLSDVQTWGPSAGFII